MTPLDDDGSVQCTVHLARLGTGRSSLGTEVLSEVERARAAGYRDAAARAHFEAGAALLRHAAGSAVGRPAPAVQVDRTCVRCGKQHGRPRLPGTGLEASVSHSGDLVAVAVSSGPAVGVDVEDVALRQDVDPSQLAARVCDTSERPHVTDVHGFLTCWTRKEAVLKATGDGLRVPLTDLVVTPPHQAAGLVRWRGRSCLACRMVDLDVGAGHIGALAVLTEASVGVRVVWWDAAAG